MFERDLNGGCQINGCSISLGTNVGEEEGSIKESYVYTHEEWIYRIPPAI